MFSIRVTGPDGSSRTVPFDGTVATVGRHADNTVVINGEGVSGRHCQFENLGGNLVLKDRGSTNGTFVNNRRVEEPTAVGEGLEVWVGAYKLQVVAMAPTPAPSPTGHTPVLPTGSLLAVPSGDRRWRDMHGKLMRIAERWEGAGRPDRLALRRTELRAAQKWLAQPEDRALPVTRLQRELIEASKGAVSRGAAKRALLLVGLFVLLAAGVAVAIIFWPKGEDKPEPEAEAGAQADADADDGDDDDEYNDDDDDDDDDDGGPSRSKPTLDPVVHTVIPKETLGDIARRYGVTPQEIADWNARSADDPIRPGDELKIERPQASPMPQQPISYEVEPGEDSWTVLAERFGVSPVQLKGYNEEEFPDGPVVGKKITIWIDPKPYRRAGKRAPVPEIGSRKDAISKGYPNDGSLENGVQMPDSELYIRRYERLMWGSGYMVANLQRAVAAFRRDIEWEGELVLADMSKQRGGHFNPHKSHQSGRDIDIWLPTLRGVFKPKYLTESGDSEWGRRPEVDEVDWFATYGLIEALAETGAVHQVFLDKSLFDRVRRAGKGMGATEEEVEKIFKKNGGVLAHSDAHTHHIHVRFKCADYETPSCKLNSKAGGGHE